MFATLFDLLKSFVIGHGHKLQSVAATGAAAEEHIVKNQFMQHWSNCIITSPSMTTYRLHVIEAMVSKFFISG